VVRILKNRNILIGCGAGISIYKSCYLARIFKKYGANVKVVLSKNSTKLINPVIFSSLIQDEVFFDQFKPYQYKADHIKLNEWADIFVVAPATADLISKFKNKIADDILTTTFMSFKNKSKIFLAPAMEENMWNNVKIYIPNLKKQGINIIGPCKGELASGKIAIGRMEEPEKIVSEIEKYFLKNSPLFEKKVLITSGATREYIDNVRFISNASSGKMGKELAEVASLVGAEVIFITGDAKILPDIENIIKITTAKEMKKEVLKNYKNADIIIGCAAVSDFAPENKLNQKIERKNKNFTLKLKKTDDILKSVGKNKKNKILIGFSLEDKFDIKRAKNKMKEKNLDMIILNTVKAMEKDKTDAIIIYKNKQKKLKNITKRKLAENIFKLLC